MHRGHGEAVTARKRGSDPTGGVPVTAQQRTGSRFMTTRSDSTTFDNTAGDRVIELRLPSRLGYEKVAMDTASSLAQRMGFGNDRVDSLRTAVSEAVTNAIEHGNKEDVAMKVIVLLMARGDELIVSVADQGLQPLTEDRTKWAPRIEDAITGPERGGWGIWLIKELVDEVEFTTAPSGGNQVRMVIHLEQ